MITRRIQRLSPVKTGHWHAKTLCPEADIRCDSRPHRAARAGAKQNYPVGNFKVDWQLLEAAAFQSLFGLSWSLRNDDCRHPCTSKLKFLRDRIVC
jgi:hypothetical protein